MPNCGIVDVGSNTIRLSIYQYSDKDFHFQLLLSKKVTAGLAGYVRSGELSPQGIQVAAGALAGFRQAADNLRLDAFHVFATASLRNISNPDEALAPMEHAAGTRVRILTGAEEGELSFLGACHGVPASDVPGLLADIGGGSTELVVYQKGKVLSSVSLAIGSLSLYTRHVTGLFPTAEQAKAIQDQVKAQLDRHSAQRCPYLRGVGGTLRAAAKLCGSAPGASIPAQDLRRLYREVKKGDCCTLQRILHVTPERVHTLAPGLIILNNILTRYQVERVDVSGQGVREGYLLRYVMGEGGAHAQGR